MSGMPRKRGGRRAAANTGGRWLPLTMIGAIVAAYAGALAAKWANVPVARVADVLPLALFLGGAAVLGLCLRVAGVRADRRLLYPALFLCGIGMVVQFRFDMYAAARVDGVARYAAAIGMGVCAVAALAFRGDPGRSLARGLAPVAFLAALAVLGVMIAFGQRFRGGIFVYGGMNPSEIIKVLLVMAWAPYLAARRKELGRSLAGIPCPPLGVLLAVAGLWLLPMLALAWLRDFGMLVMCAGVFGVMLFAASGRVGYLVGGGALAAGVTVAGYYATAHIATRVNVWRNPFLDPTGGGWQTLQALSAMYTGGAWGIGLGVGSPRLIPVASTDFVYAVIGEELGFLGCVLVVSAFVVLLRGAFDAASRQKDDASRLLAMGIATMLALQTLLNLGGVTKAIPMTGVPLPFVSRGGSSLVTSFLALGLLLAASAVSAATKRKK